MYIRLQENNVSGSNLSPNSIKWEGFSITAWDREDKKNMMRLLFDNDLTIMMVHYEHTFKIVKSSQSH